jgi:hypothetical protein
MIGERFNRWLVVVRGEDYIYPSTGKSAIRYICSCDCGETKLVHKSHLKNGSSQSCGCLNREISSTAGGLSQTRAYRSWSGMIGRTDPNNTQASNQSYRDKGITCSEDWKSFENFYRDMGDCPEGYELEREDVMGNYCKENCTWSDEVTQATNRTKFSNNTSGYTGVSWSEQHNKWRVGLYVNKIRYEGGLFEKDDFASAVKARKALELKHLGYIKDHM